MDRFLVVSPVLRVLTWLKVALCLHAILINLVRLPDVDRPWLLGATLVVMSVWTLVTIPGYRRETNLGLLAVVDTLLTFVLSASSPFILGAPLYQHDFVVVPVYWSVAAPLAISVRIGWVPGLVAGTTVGLGKVIAGPVADVRAYSSLVILLITTVGVGMFVELLISSIHERDKALATAAALDERERLNRIVHDGVLQVLALVEREGPGLGPRGRRLALLAREQENRLRALLQDKSVDLDNDFGPLRDVLAMLDSHASSTVTVSTMAEHVLVGSEIAEELDAVVTEILTNVVKHAGEGAQAWLLLEKEGDHIIVSIRDNGVGMDASTLAKAAASGRLGVQESIVGRVEDLGGRAVVTSQPGRGVEWELTIPIA